MIVAEHSKAVILVKAMCALHNFLRTVCDEYYLPTGYGDSTADDGLVRDGFWRSNAINLPSLHQRSRHYGASGVVVRERLCNYFVNEGSVPWQHNHIHKR